MPRRKGSQNKLTVLVKDAVENVFSTVNEGGVYLTWLSKEHPAAFVSLVGKCIPQAVAIDVKHTFDLGAEMLAAQANLERLSSPDTPITIDHQPNTVQPTSVTCDVVDEAQDVGKIGVTRVSRKKGKAGGGVGAPLD